MRRKTVVLLLTAALLAAATGCGGGGAMSLSEYRTRISELHDGVAWDLGVTLETLQGLDFGDYYDLPALREVFAGAEGIFVAAQDAAGPLYPPLQAEPLHADLLDFYAGGARGMRDLQNSLGFFEAVLPMLRDVENLALPNLPDDKGFEEIRAAVAEDRRTMEVYLRDVDGMSPPQGLRPYRDRLIAFFRSIDEAAAVVEQGAKPEDLAPFLQFREWFSAAAEEARALWSEASSFLADLGRSIDAYIEQGMELAARIHAL